MRTRITLSFTWRFILVAFGVILILLVLLGAVSFTLYTKISNTEELQKQLVEAQAREKELQEKKTAELLREQQDALMRAQTELAQAKSNAALQADLAAKTSKDVQVLSQKITEETNKPKEIVISSTDLTPYTTGIVQVICKNTDGSISSGSGALYNFPDVPYAILTNRHVVKDGATCITSITNDSNKTIGLFSIRGSVYSYNQLTDSAVLSIGSSLTSDTLPVANYNYSIPKIKKCISLMPVGTPIVIIGFPAYAKRDSKITIEGLGTFNVVYRTVTNGIISGYDTSQAGDGNYFVSAKIDNGNSGGIALAKDTSGLCVLGLPTWLSVGNYETQGLVQNINNILPKR